MGILHPDYRFRDVAEITPEFLTGEGIAGLLVDIDNTIVPWRGEEPSGEVTGWFSELKKAGIIVALFSNAGGPRGDRMAALLGVPVVAPAKKPFKPGYRRGLAILKLGQGQAAAVGDQVFMDVLGGNRAGLKTILVEPVSRQEFAGTKLLRQAEKLVRRPLP